MTAPPRLKVVLLWHMHQPDYRSEGRQFEEPWVYLHGMKDYVDMAWHLEAVPDARAVINFTPILLEQLEAYVTTIDAYFRDGTTLSDPRLRWLVEPGHGDPKHRLAMTRACLDVHELHVLERHPAFGGLARIARAVDAESVGYLDPQFHADLVTWFHLAWLGESQKRYDHEARRLIDKARNFTREDRLKLLRLIGEALRAIVPRYRALADDDRVELSMTPYAHPILPLLIDFEAAREALPEVVLPGRDAYPEGAARARWHVEHGRAVFRRVFGRDPAGCWPSEGAISNATVALLDDAGFDWLASGGGVLGNSLNHHPRHDHEPAANTERQHCAYRLKDYGIRCFFRDDGLSDLIGFEYQSAPAEDAVANLIGHLGNIATTSQPGDVVCIALDGENAWEHYPANAFEFLSTLYQKLAGHPGLELTTPSHLLDQPRASADGREQTLDSLISGSWVYGTLSTWIGDDSKNRAWELLCDAKRDFDRQLPQLEANDRKRAERQLAIAEGSDWFWWFGDANPADTVRRFDAMFRGHLKQLYGILGLDPPATLDRPFATSSDGDAGSMRRAN